MRKGNVPAGQCKNDGASGGDGAIGARGATSGKSSMWDRACGRVAASFLPVKKCKKDCSTPTGLEPARITPFDFESNALTTRPRCHYYIVCKSNIIDSNTLHLANTVL